VSTSPSTSSSKPFFRADQVGSLLRPTKLLQARQRFEAGQIDNISLRQAEDQAISEGVRQQEAWLSGIEIREGQASQAFVAPASDCGHDHRAPADRTPAHALAAPAAAAPSQEPEQSWTYVPKNVFTTARLSCPVPIGVPDFRYVQGCTQRTAKITLPSPTRLHFHGGRGTVSAQAYPDEEEFFADVATIYQNEIAALEAAGCRYIQIDDPLMTYFISERLRDEVRQSGDDPDKRLARYVQLTNECIARRRPDTAVGIHVCRGNSRSGWISEGGYERIAEAVLGGLLCDHLLLEYDDERSGDFQPLRHVPAHQRVVLGLVTTKRGALERADDLHRRIDEASAFVSLDRLGLSPQCGFASVVEGNLITQEDQWAKLRLVTEVARRVWG
jgi:5-methyltetrahydropteroyltriglutamate--homocysteine methyltransferase